MHFNRERHALSVISSPNAELNAPPKQQNIQKYFLFNHLHGCHCYVAIHTTRSLKTFVLGNYHYVTLLNIFLGDFWTEVLLLLFPLIRNCSFWSSPC